MVCAEKKTVLIPKIHGRTICPVFLGIKPMRKARKTPVGMANSKGNSRFTVVWKMIR